MHTQIIKFQCLSTGYIKCFINIRLFKEIQIWILQFQIYKNYSDDTVSSTLAFLRSRPISKICPSYQKQSLHRLVVTVEQITSDYAVLFTEVKDKFPETNVIISGLPPRFKDDTIRTKVKDFNSSIQKWANENEIQYIDNEPPFELRSGEVDSSVYVTTGETPNIHLTREGTTRMLRNMAKAVPGLQLCEQSLKSTNTKKSTYAEIVAGGNHNYPSHMNFSSQYGHRSVSTAPRPIMFKHSVNLDRKYAATDATNWDTNINSVKNRTQAKKSEPTESSSRMMLVTMAYLTPQEQQIQPLWVI